MSTRAFFKPGDTFDYSGQITVNGVVTDLTGWTAVLNIDSAATNALGATQLPGNTIVDVAGAWVDATLGIVRFTVADTSAWPVGNPLLLDLTLTSPTGAITTSQTIQLATDRRIGG